MTRRFHFIGIGGAGMSVVAELLAARGYEISGSDRVASPVLDRLSGLGVVTFVGHDASHVPSEATVVVSTAVRHDNPELMQARSRGQEVIHRSQALALAAQEMRFVAVAGAHGKSTTSGMLAVALREAGCDPSVAVGAIIPQLSSGAHLGGGDIFVAEADESDGSFLNYRPTIELVTNVEPDHLDRYSSRDAFEQVFVDFADRLVDEGVLIVCAEDEGATRLAQRVRPRRTVVTYGRAHRSEDVPDVVIHHASTSTRGGQVAVTWGDISAVIHLQVPGEHNLLNAVGAWTAGCLLGVDPQVMAQSLGAFVGTSRRFELRGTVAGRRLFDDYAHHPTEVAAALRQARVVAHDQCVVVVFQPHLYSRTQAFAQRFAQALALADAVVVTDIYAAREDPVPGVDSRIITNYLPSARYVPDMYEAVRQAAALTPVGGVLLTMGAGDITNCVPQALAVWEQHVD
ncbi:UDP-N-acetylmuramate--L-alanine ligase [Schaalia suimastitidis]|uniref:UDP-N-acetylmuramate--L-alanine ligase n=1 Tax=Schaalia suimastitidis TaxID=121163 RepID=UPI00041B55F7|nr:UDP-N-acetylmuramate--L-alanine ligase [Schaalia suimastitidis]